ncbi:uncharacterized protein LOC127416743 [Myxocyprinus asiaticus]|uniref:uncharacterized protein LOC127416743 n=1 Tax=Myxocyprinus asiaticus TaxID=70543 RepID=UPI0022216693|nr:uncharacterized protein LOC127416743 [Myxocyprinus asiaticus]XP_051512237.1 uncharacterized protein LOC127416743 [Myxocyprinus asiaticus]
MYVGWDADRFRVSHLQYSLLKPFLQQVSRAYTTCAKYLQKKLPLHSKTLQCLSAMDPVVRGQSQTGFELKKLTQMMSHMLPPDAATHQEILQYSVDQTLPTFKEGDDVVTWWVSVFETGKYPRLCQAVKAAMSIFHGPLVESSFNLMGDIIDPRSTSMNIATFSAIQTVKYTLQSRKQCAIEMFSRDDVKFGTVDRRLCSNINSAGTRDKAQRQKNLLRVRERRMEFDCQPSTNAAEKRLEDEEEENVARKRHIAKQQKQALERLVQAKRLNK